jgi:hypothetical protein
MLNQPMVFSQVRRFQNFEEYAGPRFPIVAALNTRARYTSYLPHGQFRIFEIDPKQMYLP